MKPRLLVLLLFLVPNALSGAMIGDLFIDDKNQLDPSAREFLLVLEGETGAIEIPAGAYAVMVRDHLAIKQPNGTYQLKKKPAQLTDREILIVARGRKATELKRLLAQGGLYVYAGPNRILSFFDNEVPGLPQLDPTPQAGATTGPLRPNQPPPKPRDEIHNKKSEPAAVSNGPTPPSRTVIVLLTAAVLLIFINIIISAAVLLRLRARERQTNGGA